MRGLLQKSRLHGDERGAAMVVLAISVVVLFAFAALAVDLGAAWAQRRTSQGAVDAAAMAGALEYLTDSAPNSATIVDIVRDYASRNLPNPPTAQDWVDCRDPDGLADGFSPMSDSIPVSIECISLKQGSTGDDETLLRVRLPNVPVNTAFASVIGFDTIDVSAVAIAEIRVDEQSSVLPLGVPAGHGTDECLGTPPLGQIHNRDTGACTDGSLQGNFGLLDSPWFEEHVYPGLTKYACGSNPVAQFADTVALNLAVGIDHAIQPWPEGTAVPYRNLSTGGNRPPAQAYDTCVADTAPPEIPYVMNTKTGNKQQLHDGLVGKRTAYWDGSPSRLLQSGGLGDRLDFHIGANTFALDNVGLWEYLTTPTEGVGTTIDPKCTLAHYGTLPVVGRTATQHIVECLTTYRAGGSTHPEFSEEILTSPRFALVPVLAYNPGEYRGDESRAIVELKPVYIHSTWYICGNGTNKMCFFQPDDFDPADPSALNPADLSVLFNPGEGTESPIVIANNGSNTSTVGALWWELQGVSALVLEWDWLYPGAKNDLGEVAPLSVYLYK